MNYRNICRLYIENNISKAVQIPLNKEQSNYIAKVMRKKVGDKVRIFNGRDGEWLSIIINIDKNLVAITPDIKIREQEQESDIWLIFSPIKHPRMQFLIEKATELGVSKFLPVIYQHTVVDKINEHKIHSYIIEAAEQCERLTIPTIELTTTISKLITNWKDRSIILCNETEESLTITEQLGKLHSNQIAIMIGPEGGFAQEELKQMNEKTYINSAQLGPRILRAETAAIAALTCYQSISGDWNRNSNAQIQKGIN